MSLLNSAQITKKLTFVDDYIKANNAADGSKLDANANVSDKKIATLEAEITKDFLLDINQVLVKLKN